MIEQQYVDPQKSPSRLILSRLTRTQVSTSLHTHNFCEFTLVTAGRGLQLVNDSAQWMEAGQLCFVRDRDVHAYRCEGDTPFEIYNQGISANALREIVEFYHFDLSKLFDSKLPPLIRLRPGSYARLNALLNQFLEMPFCERRASLFRLITAQVLWELTDTAPEQAQMPEWLSSLLFRMQREENYAEGLPRLLAISGYSQGYVNRSFRKYLNQTPTQYINRLRLEKALALLESGESALSACVQCGFNNYSHFYRCFLDQYGSAPGSIASAAQ